MNFDNKISFPDTVFFQEIDNEMVLLDMQSENYFGLDEIGCDIWKLLKEEKTLKETYDTLLEMYEVEPEQMKEDLFDFLEELNESGLIEIE